MEEPFQKIAQKSVRSFLVCFQATIFSFEVARCCIGTFSRHAIDFQIIFHPAGLVGHEKMSLQGVVFTFFSM